MIRVRRRSDGSAASQPDHNRCVEAGPSARDIDSKPTPRLFTNGSDMRKIITATFVTMDGVMQAPGGPEEDTSGAFKYGGWQATVMDDSLGEAINEFLKPPFAMLLGHTTYNIFAGYWPKQDPNNAIAKPFNEATKYVVSHEPFEPDWVNTKVVAGDVPAALRRAEGGGWPGHDRLG
jgi:dihydrofolate reductase